MPKIDLSAIYSLLASANYAYLFLALAAGLFGGLLLPRAQKDKAAALSREINSLNDTRNKTLREMLDECRLENQMLKEKLDRIESMVDELEALNQHLQEENSRLTTENEDLKKQLAA